MKKICICTKCGHREIITLNESTNGSCLKCNSTDFYMLDKNLKEEIFNKWVDINSPYKKTLKHRFATVSWTVQDVLDLMPSWDIDKAHAWLEENERDIEEQIIAEGWQILQNLLPEEEN